MKSINHLMAVEILMTIRHSLSVIYKEGIDTVISWIRESNKLTEIPLTLAERDEILRRMKSEIEKEKEAVNNEQE